MKKDGLTSLAGAPSFKTGSQLPSITDDLPPVGGAKKNAVGKSSKKVDDDFSAGEGDDCESPNEANNDDDEDESGDFDANELLNLGDYQKKRLGMGAGLGRDKENPLPKLSTLTKPSAAPISKVAPPAQRSVLGSVHAGADLAFDCSSDEDDVESSVEESKKTAKIDLSKVDYRKTDLNKLSDAELKAHKAAMEVGFQKNAVKKGDPGF